MIKKTIFTIGFVCVFVFPFKSQALLDANCSKLNFVAQHSDVIVKGKIGKIEIGNADVRGIVDTYTTVQVEKYLKGNDEQTIKIKQMGGCTAESCLWVEDEPSFKEGDGGYLYLVRNNEYYGTFCGWGVTNKLAKSYFSNYYILVILGVIIFLTLALVLLLKKNKSNKSKNLPVG